MLTTTFSLADKANACAMELAKYVRRLGGVKAYGEDTPIRLVDILDNSGLINALWSLRAVPVEQTEERDYVAMVFAGNCVAHVLHIYEELYPHDYRVRNSLLIARMHVEGVATREEVKAAWEAIWVFPAQTEGLMVLNAARAATWLRATGAGTAWVTDVAEVAVQAAWAAGGVSLEPLEALVAEQEWQMQQLRELLTKEMK